MLQAGASFVSPRNGARVDLLEVGPERARFERLYKPLTGHSDPHLHQDLEQEWQVLEGSGAVEIEGERRDLAAGDTARAGFGVPHCDVYNPHDEDLLVRWSIEPCTPFVEAYLEAFGHHLEHGTLNDQDQLPVPQLLVLLQATGGRSYRTGVPIGLQRTLMPLTARLGRLRGYRAHYDE